MPIGYYVHHHGAGHRARAEAIAAEMRAAAMGTDITLLGTGVGTANNYIDLPDDRIDSGFSGKDAARRPAWLHYAPLHHRGIQGRNAAIAAWIAQTHPSLFVVDVSVEIACLVRLCGVPVIYVRLPGNRDDPPHTSVFHDALALLAPFPKALEPVSTPSWIAEKTFHTGYILRQKLPGPLTRSQVVVVLGRGGMDFAASDIAAAAAATPAWHWTILGDKGPGAIAAGNLEVVGWIEDPGTFLSRQTILVAGAGDGTVALAAAAGCHFICIPQTRPYAEQQVTAEALDRIGAAITCPVWPVAEAWPALLARAAAADPAPLAALHDPNAAMRTAQFLQGIA